MKRTILVAVIFLVLGFPEIGPGEAIIEVLTPELIRIIGLTPDKPDPKSIGFAKDFAQALRRLEQNYIIENVVAINYSHLAGFYSAGSYTKELLVMVKRKSR